MTSATYPRSAIDPEWFYRMLAAMLPACLLAYSALIDPLLNINLSAGIEYGGVIVGSDQKSQTLTKIVVPAFLAIAVLLTFRVPLVIPDRLKLVTAPCAALLALAFASFLWAHDPGSTRTFAIYQIILVSVLLLSVCVSGEPDRILRNLLIMFAIVVGANLAMIVLRPVSDGGQVGIYGFKNTLGGAGGCALIVGLFHLFSGKLSWRLLALFTAAGGIVITVVSESKAALALACIAPVGAIVLMGTQRILALGPMITGILVLALTLSGVSTLALMMGVGLKDALIALYGDTTFTGRTDIWEFMSGFIQQSPWLGNGYRGFWSLGPESPKHASEVTFVRITGSGHSGFMDILLDLGAIGLGLLLLWMATGFAMIGKYGLRPAARSLCYMSLFIFLGFRNLLESGILWVTHFDSLTFVLVTFLACYRERGHGQSQSSTGSVLPPHTHPPQRVTEGLAR